MISDEKKEQIKLEEIYRNEIRKEIEAKESRSLWVFLNSAFGVWVLSTIVVGLLSFSYTQWKANQTEKSKLDQSLQIVVEEGQFRMAQLNMAMAEVSLTRALVLKEIIDNKEGVSGKLIRDLLQKTAILAVTIQLGGVTDIPPLGEDRRVQIGSSGYSPRNLPYAQGYKYPEYRFLSMYDLVKRSQKLKTGKAIDKNLSEKIKHALDELLYLGDISSIEPIFQDWFHRTQASGKYKDKYGSAYNVYNLNLNDLEKELTSISVWIGRIKEHLDNSIRVERVITQFDT